MVLCFSLTSTSRRSAETFQFLGSSPSCCVQSTCQHETCSSSCNRTVFPDMAQMSSEGSGRHELYERDTGIGEFRKDLPVQRPVNTRASLTAALVAAHPNNRRESLRLFEQDILANSTNPSQDSRVRTYKSICRAWQIEAFPLTLESIRCFGASLKAGGYRSAAVYFQAILGYQARHLHVAVESIHRSAIKDAVRSIRRGLGPAGLKDSFDVSFLNNIVHQDQPEPFSAENPVHMLDVVILGLCFILREAELAAARLAHLTIDSTTVSLLVPVHKTDQVGSLSVRQLNCACRYRRHHLCPWHSAFRHLKRVRLHGRYVEGPSFPLVPDDDGLTPSKYKMVQHIRTVLQTAGIAVTRPDDQGVQLHRFNGHALRVSGAQMMGSGGIPGTLVVPGGPTVRSDKPSVCGTRIASSTPGQPPTAIAGGHWHYCTS